MPRNTKNLTTQSESKTEVTRTERLDAGGIYIWQLPDQKFCCARMVEMVPIPGWITAKTGHKDTSHLLPLVSRIF
jgi:hypothetical protein